MLLRRFLSALLVAAVSAGYSRAQIVEAWSENFSAAAFGESPTDLVLDGAGGLVVVGINYLQVTTVPPPSLPQSRGFITRYDANGHLLWSNFLQVASRTYFSSVTRTPLGEFVVCGVSAPATSPSANDVVVARYDAAGNELWHLVWATPAGLNDIARDVVVDGNEDAFICGFGGPDLLVLKVSATGVLQWASSWNGSQSLPDKGFAIASDGQGGAYVTGAAGYGFLSCLATVRVDAAGNAQWWREFLGPTTPVSGYGYAVTTDAAGRVYVAGEVKNGSAPAIVAYDAAGQLLWSHVGTHGTYRDLAVDVRGDIVVVGSDANDAVVRKFDAGGTLLRSTSYDGPQHGLDEFSKLSLDDGGDAFVTGVLQIGTGSFGVLARVGAEGGVRWTRESYTFYRLAFSAPRSIFTTGIGPVAVPLPTDSSDVVTKRFDLLALPFCFGDGSSTACPCGNASAAGDHSGCVNALGFAGSLTDRGHPSLGNDTLSLVGIGMPNGGALYFQGSVPNSVSFGDGLLCIGGTLVRLGVVINTLNGSEYPAPTDPHLSAGGGVSGPGVVNYQVWYRDSASFCTNDTYNLTNGLAVVWVP